MRIASSFFCLVVLAGCTPGSEFDPPGDSYDVDGLSHVGAQVVNALEATVPGELGRTWSVSHDNRLDDGWVAQTPPASHWGHRYSTLDIAKTCAEGAGCDPDFLLRSCITDEDCGVDGRCAPVAASRRSPDESARLLCVGHSDSHLDRLHGLITAAHAHVDLTSLSPPDGRIEAALRNALTFLDNAGRQVTVRFLFGAFPILGEVDAQDVLSRLTRDLSPTSRVTVHVGNYRSSNLPPSWNHSKILAVDGRTALVGGHNLWTEHYLDIEPVHDLSMIVSGSAVRDAHSFADEQWRWTCDNRSFFTHLTGSVAAFRWQQNDIDDTCAPDAELPEPASVGGNISVIGAGRLAEIDDDANPADVALPAMLGAARSTIRISQQDIGPVKVPVLGFPIGVGWPDEVLQALAGALVREVDVAIVVSSPDASAGGLSPSQAAYANGWTLDDVAGQIRDRIEEIPDAPQGVALDALLCERLHVAPIRFSDEDHFPGGAGPANHAKLVLVDDVAFYIGSQNLYPAGLTEYGYIVDNAGAASVLIAEYWEPIWDQSSRAAISGARCD